MKPDEYPKCYRFSRSTADWLRARSNMVELALSTVMFLLALSAGGSISIVSFLVSVAYSLFSFTVFRFCIDRFRRAYEATVYIVESGYLNVRCEGIRENFSVALKSVSGVAVGNVLCPQFLRMRIDLDGGKEVIVLTLEHMEGFVSEIQEQVPVDVQYLSESVFP